MAAIRVLLVDQEAVLSAELCATLAQEPGITVLAETPDLNTALALAQITKPDVIVIAMADPGCAEMVRSIHSISRLIRVVGVSARTDRACLLRALEAGVHGVLLPSASTRTLIDAVRAVYAGGVFISGDAYAPLLQKSPRQPRDATTAGPPGRLRQS